MDLKKTSVYEDIVKKIELKTKLRPKLYPLGWVCKNAQLQVTKHCKLRFSINADFIDEVDFDVIPLDICDHIHLDGYVRMHNYKLLSSAGLDFPSMLILLMK